MTNKQIIIDGKECRYWFRPNPDDYRKCSLRGKDDNCDEIKDCFIKELLGKLALKEQECEQEKALKETYLACYKAKHGDITGELFKLKQTLTEIKEIARGVRNYLDYPSPRDVRYEMDIILQKISKVENE